MSILVVSAYGPSWILRGFEGQRNRVEDTLTVGYRQEHWGTEAANLTPYTSQSPQPCIEHIYIYMYVKKSGSRLEDPLWHAPV